MTIKEDIGTCESCEGSFTYMLIHNGFNDSSYAYCDSCGITSILDAWKMPKGIKFHVAIDQENEDLLFPCKCGGSFKSGASPRCPHCQKKLSATLAAKWIEDNAPGTEGGWRWQRSWEGLYAIVIDKRFVKDNWKS